MLVRMAAAGRTIAQIVAEYPQLSEEDVGEALRFAAASVDQRALPLDLPA